LAQVAAPVFIIFFVATGLKIQLDSLRDAWLAIILLLAVRFAAVAVSCGLAGILTRARTAIGARLLPGMLPQAGITIGLLAYVTEQLPTWAEPIADWCLGALFINLLIAPVWFSRMLAAGTADFNTENSAKIPAKPH
jgi:Kef-type K+ transport system membrane component KefB